MLWILFIPACFALNMAPGPNNLTAFANGARLGFWPGMAAGMGRMPAFAILITAAAAGLGVALAASAVAFTVIKFAGALYLIYIGIRMWRARVGELEVSAGLSVRQLARRDFLIAIANPKAIAVFTAFFPQFLDLSAPIAPQFVQLGAAFLVMEVVAVAIYVIAGRLLRGVVSSTGMARVLNKGVGGFLVFSGASLALSR
ncbi:LysE family translocator [Breoghania sp. L-A4]|uniref:LysE family translocator n=1 Tax=Breoghania sp. L-A4 TaxID=2304600 RepID=UPI000E3605C7|nr:LysE family translocator [Breoghania sp. L-A4]AXS38898.1 LysE family translocator [Breoghania sp. L-A4]